MVAIPIQFVLVILFATACCHCQSEKISPTWEKLQISPDPFSSMKYANFRIKIYEHANNKVATTISQKKYFYSTLAILDHKSAVSAYNRFTKQPEMRFRIEMWNDIVESEVIKHLKKIVGQEIQSDNVTVFPMKKIILTSNVPTEDYSLSPVWANYDSESKSIWFSLSCYDQKVCDELADEMRSTPKHLDHFKLLFSLSSQTSQTKQTTISIDSVTSGQMVFNLLQKFGDKKEIFLTANDEKKMLTETANNIRMEKFDDSEVGSPDTENQIYNILKDLLVTSRTTIKEQSDKMWDSVFWNDDNYRPDRTTKTLNEIANKLDTKTKKKLVDLFQKAERQSEMTEDLFQARDHFGRNQIEKWEITRNYSNDQSRNEEKVEHNFDANSWSDVDRITLAISGKLVNDSDSSRRVEILIKDVEKLLKESRENVQWDGEKFVPKPMQLSRINLDKFRDPQSFQDRNVRVRYTYAELSAPIKFVEHPELTITNEWDNLKDELKATSELLNTTATDLVKTSAELSNVKRDLTIKLEGTKQELDKTKIELEKTRAIVDSLSTKLNGNEKELTEMKFRAGNLSIEIKTISHRIVHELKVNEENLRKELRATLNSLETTATNLATTRAELISAKSDFADLTTKLNNRTSEIVDIGKMPSSCSDLQRMGHKLSGFFSVKGSQKLEMVYCDFYPNQNDKEKWIGYADVKSEPVHFFVQRNSSFDTNGTPIPFELTRINEGNAMNLTSGKFTAPRTGIYFFSFTGLAKFSTSSSSVYLGVGLFMNGDRIVVGLVEEASNGATQHIPLTLQSTLNLKKGDQVWLQIVYKSSGTLRDDTGNHLTHFTGFTLEEKIVSSL